MRALKAMRFKKAVSSAWFSSGRASRQHGRLKGLLRQGAKGRGATQRRETACRDGRDRKTVDAAAILHHLPVELKRSEGEHYYFI
jgi:hypothetical protein